MNENPTRVLVVDDEPAIRRFLHVTLEAHGYVVAEAENGREALAAVTAWHPDAIVLDLGLPDIDGVEVARSLREWSRIPIIIVSVRAADTDKVRALDAGADDYLTKPFSSSELLARLRAALRHAGQTSRAAVFTSGELQVDLVRRLVTVNGHEVQLTPNEYDLLRSLVKHAGKVITHRQLLRDVWGAGYEAELHLLRVNMSNLRRKIESDPARPRHIHTEPGVGYFLSE
jgi:two-component system KDP operon response regulator KdpE